MTAKEAAPVALAVGSTEEKEKEKGQSILDTRAHFGDILIFFLGGPLRVSTVP